MKLKLYHVVGIPESGLIKAYGKAEAYEKIFNFYKSCYGNDYKILNVLNVSKQNIDDKTYLKNALI